MAQQNQQDQQDQHDQHDQQDQQQQDSHPCHCCNHRRKSRIPAWLGPAGGIATVAYNVLRFGNEAGWW